MFCYHVTLLLLGKDIDFLAYSRRPALRNLSNTCRCLNTPRCRRYIQNNSSTVNQLANTIVFEMSLLLSAVFFGHQNHGTSPSTRRGPDDSNAFHFLYQVSNFVSVDKGHPSYWLIDGLVTTCFNVYVWLNLCGPIHCCPRQTRTSAFSCTSCFSWLNSPWVREP